MSTPAPSAVETPNRPRIVLLSLMPESDVKHGLAARTLKSYLAHRGPGSAVDVVLRAFSLRTREDEIAAEVLRLQPSIVGFSLYVWNGTLAARAARAIRGDSSGPVVSTWWSSERARTLSGASSRPS